MLKKENYRKVIFILIFLILGLYLGNLTYVKFNQKFKIVFNHWSNGAIPQQKFIEIRPIKYGMPTNALIERQKKGEIYHGGDNCFWCSEYAILIKRKDYNIPK